MSERAMEMLISYYQLSKRRVDINMGIERKNDALVIQHPWITVLFDITSEELKQQGVKRAETTKGARRGK